VDKDNAADCVVVMVPVTWVNATVDCVANAPRLGMDDVVSVPIWVELSTPLICDAARDDICVDAMTPIWVVVSVARFVVWICPPDNCASPVVPPIPIPLSVIFFPVASEN